MLSKVPAGAMLKWLLCLQRPKEGGKQTSNTHVIAVCEVSQNGTGEQRRRTTETVVLMTRK